jgi:O-glycosyl hydrolase
MVSFLSRYLAIFLVLTWGCAFAQAKTALVDPTVRYQSFEGWGVSLAWWAKVVGGFPDSYRDDYMEKVFDPVKGLGFNIVRYNIGGDENPALHTLPFRVRMEGFEPAPGQWNWNADAGQCWVLQQAKARGANIFEAFSNSPPYWMTLSGSVTGAKSGYQNNLDTKHAKDFAEYLATVVEHFRDQEGIVFRTLEPFNESTSGWWYYGNVFEGCHFDPHYQAWIIGFVGRALADRNLTTRVSASDENSIDDTLAVFRSYPPSARDFISQINTHSYNGNKTIELNKTAADANKVLWQSEYGDADASGITLSYRILIDLKYLRPAAWIYWQAVDGPEWGLLTNSMEGGAVAPSEPKMGKKYWVMANYSRFIRPGSVFIDIHDKHSVAALNATGHTLIVVTTNWDDHDEAITYDLSRFDTRHANITAYRTSSTEKLTPLSNLTLTDAHLDSLLPKKSVTTFVIDGVETQASMPGQ